MAKAKKVLSVVLVALFTVMTVMSYVPAQAKAKKAATPQITIVEQPAAEYTVGDRMYAKVQAPNFTGQVEYRATLWDGTEKQIIEVWKTFPYYYKNWQPTGTTVFPITWIVEKPGVYNLTVYVRPVGSKASFSTYVKTTNFTVKEKVAPVATISSVADQTAAINEGETYALPAQLEAKMSDGSTKKVDVAWNTAVDVKKIGDQVITGKVAGYDKEVKLTLTVKAVALTATVTAVGSSKLEVKFNKAVDDTKATFTVKKATITMNKSKVEFATDKKSAVITLSSKLTKGDYTVTVTGLTTEAINATVAAEDEKVAKVEFLSENAVIDRADVTDKTIIVPYKVTNQYGESLTSTTALTVTSSKGTATATSGKISIVAGTAFTVNEKVSLSAIHTGTTTFASSVVTVVGKAQVADIEITSLYNEDGYTPTDGDTGSDYLLVVSAKDQYGNKVAATNVASDIIVTVSNTAVANVAGGAATPSFTSTDVNDDGVNETTLALAGALSTGTSVITMISKTTGDIASFAVKVAQGSVVDVLNVSAPTLAVSNEKFEIPFTAVDQYGQAVVKASDLAAGFVSYSVSEGTVSFVQDYVKNTTKLVVDLTGVATETARTIVFTAITGTNKVVQLPINVVAKAKPAVVVGLKATIATNFAVNGTSTITGSDVLVIDQYGRSFNISAVLGTTGSTYAIEFTTSDDTKVSATGDVTPATLVIDGATNTEIELKGLAKGSSTLTIELTSGTGAEVAGSSYSVTAKTVAKSEIVSYELEAFPAKILATASAGYGADVVVYGVLANGDKVVVPQSGNYSVQLITTDAAIAYASDAITAGATTTFAANTTEKTVPVIVTVDGANGATILNANLVVTNVASKVASIYLDSSHAYYVDANTLSILNTTINNAGDVDTAITAVLKAKDQYGVVVPAGTTTNYITNLPAGKTIATVGAGDTFNVVIVHNATGITKTIKVILK